MIILERKIKVTQKISVIGCSKKHRAILTGLGLRHIRHTVELKNTSSIWGMINKVRYMVDVKEID